MAEIGKTLLDSGWLAARSTEVNEDGKQLTTTNPPSLASQSKWMEAVVPGTVLGTLLKNKAIPDPFYGLQNETITDIADSGRDYYTFWFFTKFQCKRLLNQYVHLNFRAINYSAEVYVNGHKTVLPKGMFRRHTLDVTDILHPDKDNLLAVICKLKKRAVIVKKRGRLCHTCDRCVTQWKESVMETMTWHNVVIK